MKKKLMTVVLGMAVMTNVNLYGWAAEWWCRAEGMCGVVPCGEGDIWYNNAIGKLDSDCRAAAEQLTSEYNAIVSKLQAEIQRAMVQGGKPNTDFPNPKEAYCSVSMYMPGLFQLVQDPNKNIIKTNVINPLYLKQKACIPNKESGISLCNDNFNKWRQQCVDTLNQIHRDGNAAINDIKKQMSDMSFENGIGNDGDYSGGSGSSSDSSDSSRDSSSSSSYGGSGSGSNYNPYYNAGSSSNSNIGNNGGTNDNQSFDAFKQSIKQGANADNNIIKQNASGNKNNVSQGDTSFYDVVGERPPTKSNLKDVR